MNRKNNQTGGWNFQTGETESQSSKDTSESDEVDYQGQISWFRQNSRSVFGFTAVITVFLVVVFVPYSSSTPAYNVPGGDISLIQPEEVDQWLRVTERVAEKLNKELRPVNPAGELLTYYHVLGTREDLQRFVSEICKEERMSFETYKHITHEIALIRPFETIDVESSLDVEASHSRKDEKQKRIEKNRDVLASKMTRLQSVWDRLHQQNK